MLNNYITLGELMRKLQAQLFADLGKALGLLQMLKFWQETYGGPNSEDAESLVQEVRETLLHVKKECVSSGLQFSAITLNEMLTLSRQHPINMEEMERLGEDLQRRLRDEMKLQVFIEINTDRAQLLKDNLFGEDVNQAFRSASGDIEEAAKCLAFERWTAAVFHLSRVAEIAIVSIGKQVGYKSPKEGFGEVLKYMDNKLKQVRDDYNNADELFKGNVEFLSGVTVHMHAVNQAWRQRVAHLDKKYTEEEALRIWDATRGLMQQLASKLQEPEVND